MKKKETGAEKPEKYESGNEVNDAGAADDAAETNDAAEANEAVESNEAAESNEAEKNEDNMESKLKELEIENADLKDKFLRKHADFENFRKRMFKEKEESIKFANSNLLGDLIPIIDDFERAINSAENSKDFDTFLKGVELIEKQFASMLEKKWGLKRFDAEGQHFDPEKHEAFMMEESADVEEPQVIEVFQKGYQLNDRVIRHAKVKVSMPLKKAEADEDGKETKPEVQE